MTPAVEIRRYASVAAFQADATSMAAAGWFPVTQTERSAGLNGGWVALAIGVALIGLLVYIPLVIVGLVILILAAVIGRKELVVTYRPETMKPQG